MFGINPLHLLSKQPNVDHCLCLFPHFHKAEPQHKHVTSYTPCFNNNFSIQPANVFTSAIAMAN